MPRATEVVTRVRFEVDDKLVVADPCYIDKDDTLEGLKQHGLGIILDDCAGSWIAEVELSDEGDWGERVSSLRVVRADSHGVSGTLEKVASNGVDSGQMFAGCLSSFPLDYDELLTKYRNADGEWEDRSFFAFSAGAVSSTGYGDGSYPVLVRRDGLDGRPAEVRVLFMQEDEEDY